MLSNNDHEPSTRVAIINNPANAKPWQSILLCARARAAYTRGKATNHLSVAAIIKQKSKTENKQILMSILKFKSSKEVDKQKAAINRPPQ